MEVVQERHCLVTFVNHELRESITRVDMCTYGMLLRLAKKEDAVAADATEAQNRDAVYAALEQAGLDVASLRAADAEAARDAAYDPVQARATEGALIRCLWLVIRAFYLRHDLRENVAEHYLSFLSAHIAKPPYTLSVASLRTCMFEHSGVVLYALLHALDPGIFGDAEAPWRQVLVARRSFDAAAGKLAQYYNVPPLLLASPSGADEKAVLLYLSYLEPLFEAAARDELLALQASLVHPTKTLTTVTAAADAATPTATATAADDDDDDEQRQARKHVFEQLLDAFESKLRLRGVAAALDSHDELTAVGGDNDVADAARARVVQLKQSLRRALRSTSSAAPSVTAPISARLPSCLILIRSPAIYYLQLQRTSSSGVNESAAARQEKKRRSTQDLQSALLADDRARASRALTNIGELMNQGILALNDLNERDAKNCTPIYRAAFNGDAESLDTLGELGADVNALSGGDVRYAPLMAAADQGHGECVRLLVEKHGADVNALSSDGATALFFAARRGRRRLDIMQCLLDNGARVEAGAEAAWRPLHGALHYGHTRTATWLLDAAERTRVPLEHINGGVAAAKQYTPLHMAVAQRREPSDALLRRLIALGADVNARNVNDATPLHLAALFNHADAARCLVDAGASLSARTRRHLTPLDVAARHGCVRAAELLAARGGRSLPRFDAKAPKLSKSSDRRTHRPTKPAETTTK